MKHDPDFPEREQRLVLRGFTVRYHGRLLLHYSSVDPTGTNCTHYHLRRAEAWQCAERRAKP